MEKGPPGFAEVIGIIEYLGTIRGSENHDRRETRPHEMFLVFKSNQVLVHRSAMERVRRRTGQEYLERMIVPNSDVTPPVRAKNSSQLQEPGFCQFRNMSKHRSCVN